MKKDIPYRSPKIDVEGERGSKRDIDLFLNWFYSDYTLVFVKHLLIKSSYLLKFCFKG